MKQDLSALFDSRRGNPGPVRPLFIFEMANNHMGDVEHGLAIIRSIYDATKSFDFQFAVKFQYRVLESFVHPDFVNRTDHALIKRFTETLLDEQEYKILKDAVDELGMVSICTPWDNDAVDMIVRHNYDVLKIPSCYFNDWPLLEKIVSTDLPIIASTAGARIEDIDRVVSFLEHRDKKFALLHCVGEYPTEPEHLQLNQIDLLMNRYAGIPIGYSTHESPDDLNSIKLAVAKGATIFEKHVGLKTDKYGLNAYSASPQQAAHWLASARDAFVGCGAKGSRPPTSAKETADLRKLYRGMYAKGDIRKGETIRESSVFFAMPAAPGQFVANEFSKYLEIVANRDISDKEPIANSDVTATNHRHAIKEILNSVKALLASAKVKLPNKVEMEISHHYGMDRFEEWGAVIINIINREYCKKLIVMLPGQAYPRHTHQFKDETMHVLFGDLRITTNGQEKLLREGDVIVVERGTDHSFSSAAGAVLEEISTTYFKGDSHWHDHSITDNPRRKVHLTYWSEFFAS